MIFSSRNQVLLKNLNTFILKPILIPASPTPSPLPIYNSLLKNFFCSSPPTIRSIHNKSATELSFKSEMMKVEQIAIPVPWGHIRGQIFGDRSFPNTRAIFCLHGYLDNSNSFKPLATYLTKSNQFYLIALDFPGHGLSSKLPDGIPYTPKMFVSSVRRAVRHLKLTSFYLMGHSYGIGITILVCEYKPVKKSI